MYHRHRNHFGRTQWYSKVRRLNWTLVLVSLDSVLILVCAECTIGSEIILDAPDGTPR
jgi:hypothetical protein